MLRVRSLERIRVKSILDLQFETHNPSMQPQLGMIASAGKRNPSDEGDMVRWYGSN